MTRVSKSRPTLTSSLNNYLKALHVECRHCQSAVSLVASGFYEVIRNQVKHGKHGLRDGFAVSV